MRLVILSNPKITQLMPEKIDVLMILEGTYPFHGGGVSTWAHTLCTKIEAVNFTVYSINSQYHFTPKYNTDQIKKIIQVPMWASLEPFEVFPFKIKYHKIISKKEKQNDMAISEHFVPLFSSFIRNVYSENFNVGELDAQLYQMWLFFQKYDYKITMQNRQVWEAFRYHITDTCCELSTHATLFDLTVSMRWLYRFLMPLSIEVPKADLSHLTIAGFAVIPALVLQYKYGTPLLLTEHGVFIRERLIAISNSDYSFFLKKMLITLSECITRLVYFKADKVISVNAFNKSWETYYGASEDKIEVVYNGIDCDVFQPSTIVKSTPPTVVAAARIFELKDIFTMIKSCAVAKKSIPNIRYLVYGEKEAVPEYTAACEALIEKLHLTDNFILAGHHPEPHKLFLEGDISILTSISEGFPYTVLESMSCGVPVVATDVGGVHEAMDEQCGFLCKPKNYEEIGSRVVELILNEPLRVKMGIAARQKVVEHFSLHGFISRYEQIYAETIQKKLTAPMQMIHHQELQQAEI